MQAPIPLSVPCMRGNEWKYLKECLDTNWVSYVGPFVTRFEKELAERCGARYAVATSSGTAALHVALLLAGVAADTEVVMPAVTFVAPANAVRYCGAWPALIGLRESDWQFDPERLESFLRTRCERRAAGVFNRNTGRRIAAIMPVHLLGGMADVDAIAAIAADYGLWVVEDAAECMGARYKGRPMAALPPGTDAGRRLVATSFNGNKIVTTGGGGAILTDDAALAARGRHLTTTAKADAVEFYHDEVGFNYRLTNLAAALGVAQLEQLDAFVARRRCIAAQYTAAFSANHGIVPHPEPGHVTSSFWLYTMMLDMPARDIIRALNQTGVGCRPVWKPIADLPAFAGRCDQYACEFANRFQLQSLSLPSSVSLPDEDVEQVAASVLEIYAEASDRE